MLNLKIAWNDSIKYGGYTKPYNKERAHRANGAEEKLDYGKFFIRKAWMFTKKANSKILWNNLIEIFCF